MLGRRTETIPFLIVNIGLICHRDYTNPYLPVAQSAIEEGGQVMVGLDGKRPETDSNVLLASIENMQYGVTLDVLHIVLAEIDIYFG
ncbi:polypyrimidine tract-binding protein [Trifolium repens]|nr:polypyrimidine tract-binding protein [Trifolium repens]